MGRVNSWLLKKLDRVPQPKPLPINLEHLRVLVERRITRACWISVLAVTLFSVGARILSGSIYSLPFLILGAITLAITSIITATHQSRMTIQEFAEWVQAQPARPSRVMRMGVPYEVRPPAAIVRCEACEAKPGGRHSRGCPAVPKEWFNGNR